MEKAIDLEAQWDKAAETYARREIDRGSFPYDVLGRFEDVIFLEAGSGDGDVSIFMAERGNDSTGLEISGAFLDIANSKIAGRSLTNLSFIKGDVRRMPFQDESFDLIFSGGVIEHFEETFASLEEHVRVLKEGGHILIGVPCKQGMHYPLKLLLQKMNAFGLGYEKSFSKQKFQRELEKNDLVILERFYFPLKATSNQAGIKYFLTMIASLLDRMIKGTHLMYFLCRKNRETPHP